MKNDSIKNGLTSNGKISYKGRVNQTASAVGLAAVGACARSTQTQPEMKSPRPNSLHRPPPSCLGRTVAAGLLLFLSGSLLYANPKGGSVIAGDAVINEANGSTLSIDQLSDRAVIEWEGFSIEQGETTRFFQPNNTSAILNRVTGGDPSEIHGALQANGIVWLINRNGVLIGPSGQVDVFGFLGSTLDIDNDASMNGGDAVFEGDGVGKTVNLGSINAVGGDVFLVGREVDNQGTIGALDGTVGLAAGNRVLVKSQGEERVFVSAGEGLVTNTGEIRSAMAELKAHGNIGALAINNSGMIRANGVRNVGGRVILDSGNDNLFNSGEIYAQHTDGSGGKIELRTGMGEIQIGGLLNAAGATGAGGSVNVMGGNVSLSAGALVDAGGTEGGSIVMSANPVGGRIDVGPGSMITANGRVGRGGSVDLHAGDIVIYANSTLEARGETDGGFLSLTGSGLIAMNGAVNASGGIGNGGQVALSGENVIVGHTGSIDANGTNGGSVALSGNDEVFVAGEVSAMGTEGRGGTIELTGDDIMVAATGLVDASGSDSGGFINLEASDSATVMGRALATGGDGTGGMIRVTANDVEVGATGLIDTGGGDSAGTIQLDAKEAMSIQGTVRSIGSDGAGGRIDITGDEVAIGANAVIDVSGVTGGDLNIGGGFQGGGNLRRSSTTTVAAGAMIRANGSNGDAGNVVVWSDGETQFRGNIEAEASGVGNGGFVEVSGRDQLTFRGNVSTNAENGAMGTLLLDPMDVTIVDSGSTAEGTLTEADVNAALLSNNLVIHTGGTGTGAGNILVDNDVRIEWGTPNTDPTASQNTASLTLLATGDVTVEGHIISHGAGNVNLFAGWDGATGFPETPAPDVIGNTVQEGSDGIIDFAQISEGLFGTPSGGDVLINTRNNNQAVQVGSRFGEINVFAENLLIEVPLRGSDRFAHLGYRATTHVESGGAGDYGFDPVTHAGLLRPETSGDINVQVQGDVILAGEQIGDARKYTQIGHGGSSNVFDTDPITSGGGSSNEIEFSLIDADHSGNINVDAGLGSAESQILLQAGRDTGFSRIGHGGLAGIPNARRRTGRGAFQGDISVINHRGNLIASGGNTNGSWGAFTQIGHGGFRNGRTADVVAGSTSLNRRNAANYDTDLGPRAFDPDMLTPDGNPVGDRGNIHVEAIEGLVLFRSGSGGNRSGAILGHGGHERAGNIGRFDENGNPIESADITVRGTNVLFLSQSDQQDQTYVKLGHGGYQSPGAATGTITVEATDGDILFEAGEHESYAHLGHGGMIRTWNSDNQGIQGTLSGNIDVQAAGNVSFRSGYEADRPYSMIGHGGFGWHAYSKTEEFGGNLDPLQRGHHGDIMVDAGGAIDFSSGQPDVDTAANSAFSMIGHGGNLARGDHYGRIDVNAGTGIRFEAIGGWDSAKADNSLGDARGDTNFVQIGHGGRNTDFETSNANGGFQERALGGAAGTDRDSSITVTAADGNIEFISPQTARTAAQEAGIQDATSGRWADEDDSKFSPYAARSWAKIGHGGVDGANYNGTGIGGDITVEAPDGSITLVGSDFQQGFSDHVALPDAYRDEFSSRRSEQNYTQIGHGGVTIRGDKTGHVSVSSLGDISLMAGLGRHDHVQVGHGGWDSDNGQGNNNFNSATHDGLDGTISVWSEAGSVLLHGGSGDSAQEISDYSFAQIGHGGRSSSSSVLDDAITVQAGGGDVEVHAGFAFRENYALIGHGGRESRAQFLGGAIDVFARDNVSIMGTEYGYGQAANFGQIGHGGWDTEINNNNRDESNQGVVVSGSISVVAATGDVVMLAGVDNLSAQSGGIGNFRYDDDDPPNTGYAGNAAITDGTDFSPGPDGVFGTADDVLQAGPDGLFKTADDIGGRVDSEGYIYGARGHAGERYDHDGNGDTDFDNNVRPQGGWAQIGHGGQHTNITQIDETITVTAGNDLIAVGGEFRDAKVAIGSSGGPDSWGSNRARRRTIATGTIDVTVGDDLLLNAGSGDNASIKIGHGGYQTTSDRSRVEGGIDSFGRRSTWEGDIFVKVGDSAILDADETARVIQLDDDLNGNPRAFANGALTFNAPGLQDTYAGGTDFNRVLIGHRDTEDSRAVHSRVQSAFGNTYLAVSRDNPTIAGTGTLETFVSENNPHGVVLNSAGDGIDGQLRVYAPSRESLRGVMPGTILNSVDFNGVPNAGARARIDEYVATGHAFTLHTPDSVQPPMGRFGPQDDPDVPYLLAHQFGRHGLYYANPDDELVIPGGGPLLPPTGGGGGGDAVLALPEATDPVLLPEISLPEPEVGEPISAPLLTILVSVDGAPIQLTGNTVDQLQANISERLEDRGIGRFQGNDTLDDRIGEALGELFEPAAASGEVPVEANYPPIPIGSTGSTFTTAIVAEEGVFTPLSSSIQAETDNGTVIISLELLTPPTALSQTAEPSQEEARKRAAEQSGDAETDGDLPAPFVRPTREEGVPGDDFPEDV